MMLMAYSIIDHNKQNQSSNSSITCTFFGSTNYGFLRIIYSVNIYPLWFFYAIPNYKIFFFAPIYLQPSIIEE